MAGLSLLLVACGGSSSSSRPALPGGVHTVREPSAGSTSPAVTGPTSPAVGQGTAALTGGARSGSSTPHGPPLPRGVIVHGPRTRRWVALTFDADMTRGMLSMLRSGRVRGWYDHALFDELRATRTPATIFLTGLWTRTYPEIVRRLAHDPRFELENHSLDHAGWITPCYGLPPVPNQESKRQEIVAARRIIERVARIRPRFFRFPGGCETDADVRLVESYGERPVGWDVVSGDAFQPSEAVIVRAVLAGVRPGSIVVAHCIGAPNTPATAAAMRVIIPALRARGYRFVTLRQLLRSR